MSYVNNYMYVDPMVIFTAWAKNYSVKYFYTAKVSWLYSVQVHVCTCTSIADAVDRFGVKIQ